MPESAQGGITVLRPGPDNSLEVIDKIHLPYTIDNLSEDQDGNLWAAIIPRGIEIMKQPNDPHHYFPSSSVFKLSRDKGGKFITDKILEDSEGSVMPGTTTVVHDARTGRLFLGGTYTHNTKPECANMNKQVSSPLSSPFVILQSELQ